MPKYKVTNEHPFLKAGTIIEYPSFYSEIVMHNKQEGYMKEIKEPKWTDDDMVMFANCVSLLDIVEKDLEKWENDRK